MAANQTGDYAAVEQRTLSYAEEQSPGPWWEWIELVATHPMFWFVAAFFVVGVAKAVWRWA